MGNWGHSTKETVTIVIEDRNGDPVDIDAVAEALESLDLKLGTWGDGDHMLARGAIRRAVEGYESALRMIGAIDDEDEVQDG